MHYTKIILFFLIGLQPQNLLLSQCGGYENFPEGEAAAQQLFQTYRRQLANNEIEAAFKNWKLLYEYAPAGAEQHYKDGVTMYKKLMRRATESSEVVLYQSELLRLYDRRMKCFGYPNNRENVILGEKAVEMFHINYDESVTVRTFKYVLETGEMRHAPEFVEVYGTYCNYLFGSDRLDLFHLWESQQVLKKIVAYNLKNTDSDSLKNAYNEAMARVQVYYDTYLNSETDCTPLLDNLKNNFLTAATDSARNAAYDAFQNLNCIEAFLVLDTLRNTHAAAQPQKTPDLEVLKEEGNLAARTAQKAALAYDRNQYLLAIELYEQALTETGSNVFKSRCAYRIAEICTKEATTNVSKMARWKAVGSSLRQLKNGCLPKKWITPLRLTLIKKLQSTQPCLCRKIAQRQQKKIFA